MEVKKIEEFKKGDIICLVKSDCTLDSKIYTFSGYVHKLHGFCLREFYDASFCRVVKKGTLATEDFM